LGVFEIVVLIKQFFLFQLKMIIFWNGNLKTFIIRRSTVFSMLKRKTRVPVSGLFDQGYKFSYFFCEGLSKQA